jgi:hypothetical protein
VRELTMSERAYINTSFAGDDGGRPYIKSSYWSRAPNENRSGFIYRSLVPGHVRIQKNDSLMFHLRKEHMNIRAIVAVAGLAVSPLTFADQSAVQFEVVLSRGGSVVASPKASRNSERPWQFRPPI